MRTFILAAALAVSLLSCSKREEQDPAYCWRCSVTAVEIIDNKTTTTLDTLCNRTKSEIDAYEKAGNWQIGNNVPYGTYFSSTYSSMVTTCTQL